MSDRIRLWASLLRLAFAELPGYTAGAFIALAASVVALPVTAVALRWLVNAMSQGDARAALVAAIAVGIGYAATLSLDSIADAMVRTALDRLGRLHLNPRIVGDICRVEGIEHLERPEFLDRLSIVRAAASRVAGILWMPLLVGTAVAKLLLMALLLGTISPLLIVLAVLGAAPIFFDRLGERRIREAELRTADPFRLQQHLYETVTTAASAKELMLNGSAPRLRAIRERLWEELQAERRRAQRGASVFRALGWFVFVVAFVGGIAFIQATNEAAAAGDIVLTIVVATSLRNSIQMAIDAVSRVTAISRFAEPFRWLSEYASRHAARDGAPAPDRLDQGISLRDVSLRYEGADRDALSRITVDIPAGSTVAVVGEFGSGKTTLVKLLARLMTPTSGSISVDGVPLESYGAESWWAACSGVFQDFGRFRVTLGESIGMGDIARIDDEGAVRAAIGGVGADRIVDRLEHGLNTWLGADVGGVDLSEGQWQRVALARGAMRAAPVLLMLDEPTASLDAEAEDEVFRIFADLAVGAGERTGAITVLVSHRFSTVRSADLILVIRGGRLIEQGSHAQLMAADGEYAELYRLQVESYHGGAST